MAGLKGTFSKGLTTLNVKTSTFLEIKKIQTHIATLNSEIEMLEKEIGEIIWKNWDVDSTVNVELVGEQLVKISEKKKLILERTAEMEQLEREGREILGSGDNPESERIFCPNCGQAYETAVNFCRKCGTKLQ